MIARTVTELASRAKLFQSKTTSNDEFGLVYRLRVGRTFSAVATSRQAGSQPSDRLNRPCASYLNKLPPASVCRLRCCGCGRVFAERPYDYIVVLTRTKARRRGPGLRRKLNLPPAVCLS
jgi:hypothetical protein